MHRSICPVVDGTLCGVLLKVVQLINGHLELQIMQVQAHKIILVKILIHMVGEEMRMRFFIMVHQQIMVVVLWQQET